MSTENCTPCQTACQTCEPGVSDSNIVRNRLDLVPWENRQTLIIDNCRGARDYLVALSPMNRQFMVHPLLNSDTALFMVWDGLKMDFQDSDIVPVPEWAAEAVAEFVKAKIARIFDRRLDLEQAALAQYARLRARLYLEQHEAQFVDGKDEEYNDLGNFVIPPNAFQGFGAQEFPYLSTVTQLEGSDNTALAAVPTPAIPLPYGVNVTINTILQTWVLRASDEANDPDNGVLRPNDWAAGTNERVWFKENA